MDTIGTGVLVRGEAELFAATAHLFANAAEIACAAADLNTWVTTRRASPPSAGPGPHKIRKLYRPGVLLEPERAEHLYAMERLGAGIRITRDEILETIILDNRFAILAGDRSHGERAYRVVDEAGLVRNIVSLFDAAWRAGTELSLYDAEFAEVRALAPRILDVLASGCKDETAARTVGLSVRTYRRRVADLMSALGATSRFQAGVRARELGLV
ncbi:DNA-binding response regulator [Amycolatopsis cynarae]|uniref:DNA-binding response regulator n=1 Tax=Amycolatopsis cynarae TaxID=2995223 RepID=A0ABY7AZ98_9PSEU|nr:DNA-binding response regulator [Amycolatopsis sp. HUAS 11-8]WAL65271.1 DNA-binding response regulator [Amycolatopsis sp. HUAS 11-8]